MEQKAPRLSSASLVVGGLCVAFAILNSTADLILQAGLTVEEVASLGLAGCCFVVSFLASRERPIPELLNQPTIQEQYDALESTPTPYRSSSSEQSPQQSTTAPVSPTPVTTMPAFEPLAAPSPIEHAPVPSPDDVASALASLSSGSIGTAAAEEVAVNPAPHIHTEQGREFTQPVGSLAETFVRTPITNVPLPSKMNEPEPSAHPLEGLPSMPDLDELLNAPPAPSAVSPPSVPSLPDLDALLNSDSSPVQEAPTTPDLPDLEGLF